jgi:hypothetical protein
MGGETPIKMASILHRPCFPVTREKAWLAAEPLHAPGSATRGARAAALNICRLSATIWSMLIGL